MKRKILIFFIPLLSLFWGCEKELMTFEGREGVYFAVQHGNETSPSESAWPYQPFSPVAFIKFNKPKVNFAVKVMITGPVKDYDRTFRVEVNPDSTTAVLGVHYDAFKEDWILPANSISTNIVIPIKRTTDIQVEEKTLGLRLVPTKDFELSFPEWDAIPGLTQGTIVPKFDASMHTLRINDIMVKPPTWIGSMNATTKVETGSLGVFSRKKMEFIIENLGISYEEFLSAETMPLARISLVTQDASAILIERFDAGTPVLDEDRRLMYFGAVPWTSKVGEPYVK